MRYSDRNRRERWMSLVWVLLGLLSLLVKAIPAGAQTDGVAFDPGPCPVSVPTDTPIDCGTLTVPEDHADPSGAKIALPVVIVHNRSANAAPDPILITEGGPGLSSLTLMNYVRAYLVEDRDVIIFEQRGNVYTQPSLACDIAEEWTAPEGRSPCLDSLRARDIDPTHFTIEQSVADIEALRMALGIEQWNLYGMSFSTRLMLLTMQQYPEAVRSVILDSVSPIDDNRYAHDPEFAARALNKLFDDCAADPACAEAYPELEARFYRLFSRLNAQPARFTITDGPDGRPLDEPITAQVTGYDLLGWMVGDAFYDGPANGKGKTRYLPLLIDRVEAGNTQLLYPWLVSDLFNSYAASRDFAWGLYLVMVCQNDFPEITQGAAQALAAAYPELEGYRRYAREMEICAQWDLPAAPLHGEPVRSDIPTLVLAGGYDPVTAPLWGRETAAALNHSIYLEFPSSGHGVAGESSCARQVLLAFIADPRQVPDTSCIASEPSPSFVLPSDILAAPHYRRSVEDLDLGTPRGKPWLEVTAVGGMLVFLVEIGFLIVAGVVRLVRRQHAQDAPLDRAAHLTTGLTAMLGLSIMPLMSVVTRRVYGLDPIGLAFGLPADFAPAVILGIVALLFAALSGAMIVFSVRAWVRGTWSVARRVWCSVVTITALAFVPLLARWGLITMMV